MNRRTKENTARTVERGRGAGSRAAQDDWKPAPAGTAISAALDPYRVFFLIAFIEGASVMAIELAGAKMMAPYYGSSLYVWASVLSVTLGGLTSGYFLGGRLVSRYPGTGLLLAVLVSGTALVAVMPFVPEHVVPALSGFGIRTGALVSAACVMILPLVCMGMVSPILIQRATRQLTDTGKTAGTVYAVSTVGGILMTLLMGFYLLPEWGIRRSVFLTASLLGLTIILYVLFFHRAKVLVVGGSYLAFVGAIFLFAAHTDSTAQDGLSHIQFRSEGVLGQITVLDHLQRDSNRVVRLLLLNEVPQTHVSVEQMPASAWLYPHRLAVLASVKPEHSKALLIGMGGGSVAMELKRMGFSLDVVEIDSRITDVAKRYFGFDGDGMNVVIDDGRHYLGTVRKTYDLVVIDVLNGEVQPFQLFTLEAFADLKRVLAPGAVVLINYQGYLKGENGRSARAIYKTLLASGLRVKYHTTSTETASGDVTLIASATEQDFHALDARRLNPCCASRGLTYENLVSDEAIDLKGDPVLTDDRPQLETLSHGWNEQWRQKAMKEYEKVKAPWFD